jgi:hypothetical protein
MRAVLIVIAFSGALGCAKGLTPPAAAPDAAARSRPSPLRAGTLLGVPGENIEYVVSLRGFTLGTVIVAVGQIGEVNGHRAVVVRSRGSGSGAFALFSELSWELKTVLALDIGDALTEEETIDAELVGEKVHEHQKRNIAGESTYNVHSAAGALRAWRSKIDDTSKFDVRISDIYLSVELTDVARERHGDLPAVRYDGVASATGTYKLSIWISDDEARVPLKFTSQTRWGEMVVEMVSYDVARDFASNP